MPKFTRGKALESLIAHQFAALESRGWVCYDLRKESMFRGENHDFLVISDKRIFAFDCKECREDRFYFSILDGGNGRKQLNTFARLLRLRPDVIAGFMIYFAPKKRICFLTFQLVSDMIKNGGVYFSPDEHEYIDPNDLFGLKESEE